MTSELLGSGVNEMTAPKATDGRVRIPQQGVEDALGLLRQTLEILDRERFPSDLRARVSEIIEMITSIE